MGCHHEDKSTAEATKSKVEPGRIQDLIRIHDETTAVFETRGINPRYRVLIDTHLSYALQLADKAYKSRDEAKLSLQLVDIAPVSLYRCRMAEMLVEERKQMVKACREAAEDRMRDLDDVEIEALWWILMLRSICWWLSVEPKRPIHSIPSRWYNSKTPVYMT